VILRRVEPYGEKPLQRGEWWIPVVAGPLPTVVLVHGGFWRPRYDRSLEDSVAADLCGRGYLCWNIDYAAADQPWPATLRDVAAGYDHLLTFDRVDPARIAVVGHSAGGHLALWLASRHRLAEGAPGAPSAAVPRPRLAVAQGAVAALGVAARQRLGAGAVQDLLGGGPDEVPGRYAVADPLALLPTGVRTVLIHGTDDADVPVSQAERYVAAATADGDDATLRKYVGAHFEHLEPDSEAGDLLRQALLDGLGVDEV
jgi:acetyl esterase/lipase